MRHRPENGIPYRAIVITSSNGDSQAIWTALMAQDAHDVAARLKSLLRLKGDLRAG
jgi:hypothetical protein